MTKADASVYPPDDRLEPNVLNKLRDIRGPGEMSHIRELASHSTMGLQVDVIWTLPRTVSLMISE